MINASNKKIARAIFGGIKNDQSPDASRIAGVMNNIPTKDQRKVISYLKEMVHAHEGIVHVKITTPGVLDPNLKEKIRDSIKSQAGVRDVAIEEVIDESLLGGLKIQVQDTLYDSTVKRRLNQLRNQFR